MNISRVLLSILTLSTTVWSAQKQYGPGVSDTEIKIGNIVPYSGPASAYGTIGKAQAAYFKMLNERGGINGRKITFITLDGAYNPSKTVEMTRRLVEQDQVLLLFALLGTPPNVAVQKYLNSKKVPQLFVMTGASRWNDPANFPWTMGLMVDYRTEARMYAAHILKHTPKARIGILYQNDDYGKDYVSGLKSGLGDRSSMIVAEATYDVTDPTVDSQIIQLKSAGADVFFNVTTPKFAAQAIRKAHDIGWRPVHYLNTIAASIGSVIIPAGVEKSQGIISSDTLKDPSDPDAARDPAIIAWRDFMAKYYPEGSLDDRFNVTAHLFAETLAHVLERCGDNLTRENVMKQAASLTRFSPSMSRPGITLDTSPTDYAPAESVQLIRLEGRRWVPFGEVMLANSGPVR